MLLSFSPTLAVKALTHPYLAVFLPWPSLVRSAATLTTPPLAAVLTPEEPCSMNETQVAAALAKLLPLSAASVGILTAQRVTGRRLLAMSDGLLEKCGLEPCDAEDVKNFVGLVRSGGPKTVELILTPGSPAVTQSFETPNELTDFLARQGAAGLRGGDRVLTSRLKQLKEGGLYWLDFSSSLKAGLDRVKETTDTDAMVVIENAKRAVESASVEVFGEALKADPRDDIPLRVLAKTLGDVDCLFTGPTIHLLMERKRRLSAAHGATSVVIAQLAATREAYVDKGLNVVGGSSKEGGGKAAACRVESMVFAEALSIQAQKELLMAGVYVLCQTDMRIHSPPWG